MLTQPRYPALTFLRLSPGLGIPQVCKPPGMCTWGKSRAGVQVRVTLVGWEGPSEWGLDTSIKGEGMRPRVDDLKATKTNPTQGHKSQVSGTGSLVRG